MKTASQNYTNPASDREAEGGRRPTGASRSDAAAADRADPAAAADRPRVGRPLKYRHLIEALEDGTIYSPGAIARYGEEKGLLPQTATREEKNIQRLRIRHTLARLAVNHGFPRPGEGWVNLKGQGVAEGWRGATWKAAISPKQTQP